MNIAICDDETAVHTELTNLIHCNLLIKDETNIIDFYDAESLLETYYQKNLFDIIFLDIEMDKTTGIEAAEKIRQISQNTIIIFISNYPSYVFDAFKVEALHFIVKPISHTEFDNAFERAIHKYQLLNSSITLKWQNEIYIIKINSIMYIEGYKRHITVYTTDGVYDALGKIPELLKILSPHGFIRTHQGFIVNMDYIKRFESTDVILFDDTKVMMSVRKRSNALCSFDNYLKKRKW